MNFLISKQRECLVVALTLSLFVGSCIGQEQQDAGSGLVIPSSLRPELNNIEGSSYDTSQQRPQPQQQQQPGLDGAQQRVQWPMVNVDGQGNKSKVDVHVPIFFDMTNHNDKNTGNSKLDLSVMQGLVTVNSDKARDQSGQVTGPVKVTVFGIPVYTGKGILSPPQLSTTQRQLTDNITQVNSNLARRTSELAARIAETTQRNNEMIRSLSDMFERFSVALRQTGGAQNNLSQQQLQN